MELTWFVGVDWGSQTHQACVIDVAGTLLGERAFEHAGALGDGGLGSVRYGG